MRYIELISEAKSPAAKQAIVDKYGPKLEARIKEDNRENNLSVEGLLDRMEAADPSPKSIYVDWLVREYILGNIRYIEDIGKATEFLPWYDKSKPKLPVAQRNVLSYDFDGLWDMVRASTAVDTRSKSEKKNDFEASLIKTGQAKILLDTEWKVVELHSKEAAIYYGKNTKWCTASRNNNMFDEYYEDGPIYVALRKATNNRWQYHPASNQFMDEMDKPFVEGHLGLNPDFLVHAPSFPDLVIPQNVKDFCLNYSPLTAEGVRFFKTYANMKKMGDIFEYADDEARVTRNPYVLDDIPQTPELCMIAVKVNGDALRCVEHQTPELCMAAVMQDGDALRYVREQTHEICMAAVKQHPKSLRYAKEQNPEMCMIAVTYDGYYLQYVRQQTPELCMAAVMQDGNALRYVEEQTHEICMAAVVEDGDVLRYVREQTPELCAAAVEQSRYALNHVDPALKPIVLNRVAAK